MTVRPEILLMILACMAVTIVPRVLPLVLAQVIRLPRLVEEWLTYIPIAVIAALLADQLLLVGESPGITWSLPHVLAGIGALAIAAVTRSIALTVIGGVAMFAVLQLVVS
ncbi:MAG: AzlD domain-containing protein [Ectothiorhodospiraceae bacterium]|nr:AzlD domain-containing protein [Ectothiorhodospiraceae bacterium]